MKIKLKTLGLPSTTGIIKEPQGQNSSADWELMGTTISEVYWQERDGRVAGEMLGLETTIWIPYRCLESIDRNNILTIDSNRYEILDIKREIYSEFEDHWEVFIKNKNQ